jgi:hypothetical protein
MNDINNEMFWRAFNKWEETTPIEIILSITALKKHMIEEYGIKISAMGGMVKSEIVDEKKYMMFLLKYS